MPLDPSLSLQAQPVQIQPLDLTKTMLSVAQIKYLMSEEAQARARTALTRTQGAEAEATYAEKQRVRDVAAGMPAWLGGQDSPPLAPQTPDLPSPHQMPRAQPGMPAGGPGGPGMPQPGAPASPPPPGMPGPGAPAAPPSGAAPAAMQPRGDNLSFAQRLIAAGPFEGREAAKSFLDLDKQSLENQGKHFELTKGRLALVTQYLGGVKDQAGWDLGLELIARNGGNIAGIPKVFSPQTASTVAEMTRTAQQRVEEDLERGKLKTAQHKADSERILAQAGATTAQHKQAVPTARGFGTFNPVTGEWEKPTIPTPGGGQEPVTAPAQATRAQEMNAGWMNSPQNQVFLQSKQAVTDLQTAAKLKTGVGDMAVVSAYNRVIEPRSGSSPGKVEEILQLGTLSQQAQRELGRLFTKGTQLSDPVRQEIVTAAQKTYDTRVAEHQLMRKHMLNMSRDLGVSNPETVIPDLSTAPQAPSAPDRTITLSEFDDLMKHPSAQGKTRAQVVSDLAKKGIRVRPDEGPR